MSLESCDKLILFFKSIFIFGFNSNNAVASIIELLVKSIVKLVLFFNAFKFSKSSYDWSFSSFYSCIFVSNPSSPVNNYMLTLANINSTYSISFKEFS